MILPEYVATLDPFSREAREIVVTSPPLHSLPREVVERAVERVNWKSSKEMIVDFRADLVRAEVLSFYLMCQGVAAVSYPYSREARLVGEATKETIKYRIYDLFRRGYEEMCLNVVQNSIKLLPLEDGDGTKVNGKEIPREDYFKLRDMCLASVGIEGPPDDKTLVQYLPKYAVRWTDLAPLLKHHRLELTNLYLIDGWAIITPRELWDIFANFVSIKTEEYIASLYERFSEAGAPPNFFVGVGERISSLLPPEIEFKERFARFPRGKLRPDFFPPCVRTALGGVGSGARNYAVTVLLTSFISHARISPSGKAAQRIKDFINDMSVVREEIVPLIFEAAERCNPPFFRDQPQEKANVYYHLGFGMNVEPRLEDSGRSKWYSVPNCKTIQVQAPQLCNPDEFCQKIKNPITYYFKKFSE